MTERHQEIEELAAEIDRLATEKPYAASLLQAFGPLFLGQQRWLSHSKGTLGVFPVDPLKYQEGVPLMQQCRLLLPEDPWQEAGASVAEAIGHGFPRFSGDMLRLAQRIKAGQYDCFTLCDAADDNDRLAGEAAQLGIEPVALQLFRRYLTRWMLAKTAQGMTAELASLPWNKGYCPICGSLPHLAIIREHGQRWLQCSTCNHEWRFPRLTCPYCDHEDPQETNTLFIEGNKEEFAFTCVKCSRYLITSNQSGNLRQSHADLLALVLVYLDHILQEKGFLPMAPCAFNTFSGQDRSPQ